MYYQADMSVLIERIEASNKKNLFYAKLQCIFSFIALLCFFAALALILSFLPKLQNLIDQASIVMANLEVISTDLSSLDLSGLSAIVAEMSKIDMTDTIKHIDELVATSQGGIEATVEKLNSLDLETLNKAIENFSTVVERLAKITKIFG